jgi:hypothetical protein
MMNTKDVQKAILFHWMHRIFITKEMDRSEFKDKRAIEILNMAGFNIPFTKAIKPFLDETTNEFKQAVKEKRTSQLLEKYPFPKMISEDGKKSVVEKEPEFEVNEDFDENVVLEPTIGELEIAIEDIISKADLETITVNVIIKQLEDKYKMPLKHRKDDIKKVINDVLAAPKEQKEEQKEESSSESEPESSYNPVKRPRKKEGKKDNKKVPKKTTEDVIRRFELREKYWKLNNEISTLRAVNGRDNDFLYDRQGDIDQKVLEQINYRKQQMKELKKELLSVEDELTNLTLKGNTWSGEMGSQVLFETEEEETEVKKGKKDIMSGMLDTTLVAREKYRKTFDEISEPKEGENLKYLAFLSYYMISPLIAVEDPTLETTFKSYPDLETSFKMNFANLSIKQRYEFIKTVFNGRSFKEINNLIENGSLKDRNVNVSLSTFKHEPKNSEDEMEYNLMMYVEPNKDYSRDVMIANIVNELKRKTGEENTEKIKYNVEKVIGVASDKTSILENVHKTQLANIKILISKNYSTLASQSDEEMRTIQLHYEEVRPSIKIDNMEETILRLPSSNLLYSLSGSSEYRSDLLNIAKTLKNTSYETEIYRIKKDIENNEGIRDLGKSEKKKAEQKYIKKQIEKGELSQVAGSALLLFISYYGSTSSLPSNTREKERMFEYRRVEDLPEYLRPSAENELRKRLSEMLTTHNKAINDQKDILSKIQIELNSESINIISVADKINRLQASEEVKNKLLTRIQKEGKINVYTTYKALTNKMLLNPLEYRGINRSRRVKNTLEEMSELDKIKASFPKQTHTISYCLTQLYLKPWLDLPPSFDYFLAHPMDLEKEDMSDKERFLYGEKINGSSGEYDNLYRPTTIFWRVYCTEFLVNINGMYSCNTQKINYDLIDRKTRSYVLGVYDKSKNDSFRSLTGEDYKKECDWFKNNDINSIRTIGDISSIDLNINIKLRKVVREYMKEKIKAVLALIYNAHEISLKNENMLNIDSKKIENELFEQSINNGKVMFYTYVYDVLNFLYLINPSSPLYPFTTFFQRLLLTGSKANYSNIIKMTKNIGETLPEIYLIDNKKEFLELVESKIREDTITTIKTLRTQFEPGFKFPMQSSQVITVNYNEKINNKLASFDHSKFKNLCKNYNEVKDPFFVTQIDKEHICIGKEEFYSILRDEDVVYTYLPMEVIDRVKSLVKTDKSDELKRIFTMQYIADDFASSHFILLTIFRELFTIDINTDELKELIAQTEDIQKAINRVETVIGKLSEDEVILFVNHLIAQAYNYFIQSIKEYIDHTEFSSELKERLVDEYKKRLSIYNDEKLMNNDRAERIVILKDLFNTLSNKYGDKIDEDTQEIIVDYFHIKHILPLVKGMKLKYDTHEGNNPFYTPSCSICSKVTSQKDVVKTYLYKNGKKVLAEFCSTKCMSKTSEDDYEIPKDIKEITLDSLVEKITIPISLTYDELIHRTKLIGMSLPENIQFNQAYVSWLSNSSFEDKIWLEYHHETLDKISKYYNIVEDNVTKLWKELINNNNFYSLFHSKLEKLSKPYDRYVRSQVSQELYSDDCKYPKVQVEMWLKQIVDKHEIKDWMNHSFKDFNFDTELFTPFFTKFNNCNNLVNSIKERSIARNNRKFILNILNYMTSTKDSTKQELRENIESKIDSMNFTHFEGSLMEHCKKLLIEKLNIKKATYSLERTIETRMNSKGDQAPILILAEDLKLDINDSETSVELYRDFLLMLGIDFINKYINSMNAVTETIEVKDKKQKRKLRSEYKAVVESENKLTKLKEESSHLNSTILSINKTIDDKKQDLETSIRNNSKGKWAPENIEQEIKELENSVNDKHAKQVEIEFEIEELENEVVQEREKLKIKKQAPQKKGVFRKVAQKTEESTTTESPSERIIQIENTLKINLFGVIAKRLPENINLYYPASMLGLIEQDNKNKVVTLKMLKDGKIKLNPLVEGEEELENIIEEELGTIRDSENEEAIDKENLEEYVEDTDADEDDDLGEKEGDYGEAGEEEYSY